MKEAYYFPHDANARTDAKILELRSELGWEGYGLWWALVEQLREATSYRLSNEKTGGLAMGLNIPKKQLESLLALCFDVGLLELEDGYFYSPSLRRRMESLDAKRALRQQAGSKGGTIRAQREAAARAKGTHTQQEWQEVMAFCGNSCARCGSTNHIEKDHIQPIYQGGSDDITNLQPLCKTCNTSKGPSSVDYRFKLVQAMLAPIPSKLQALLNPVDLTTLDLTKPKESKEKQKASLRSADAASAAASPPEKKIEHSEASSESPPANASHTRGPDDVPTRKGRATKPRTVPGPATVTAYQLPAWASAEFGQQLDEWLQRRQARTDCRPLLAESIQARIDELAEYDEAFCLNLFRQAKQNPHWQGLTFDNTPHKFTQHVQATQSHAARTNHPLPGAKPTENAAFGARALSAQLRAIREQRATEVGGVVHLGTAAGTNPGQSPPFAASVGTPQG